MNVTNERSWEQKCTERQARDTADFERDGLSFSDPACRFYKDGHGNPVRYPHGMTAEAWSAGPARSSALAAVHLPED